MATKTTTQAPPQMAEGQIVHTEIVTTDPKAMKTFMEKVFGWKFETSKMPEGDYHSFKTPGGTGGGVMAPVMSSQPIAATPYILVNDAKAAQKKVEKAGATIVMPTDEIPNVGWFFMFQVKGGPILACFQPKMPA